MQPADSYMRTSYIPFMLDNGEFTVVDSPNISIAEIKSYLAGSCLIRTNSPVIDITN
jgi:hypothetical protein